jgi:hypothetical protein
LRLDAKDAGVWRLFNGDVRNILTCFLVGVWSEYITSIESALNKLPHETITIKYAAATDEQI